MDSQGLFFLVVFLKQSTILRPNSTLKAGSLASSLCKRGWVFVTCLHKVRGPRWALVVRGRGATPEFPRDMACLTGIDHTTIAWQLLASYSTILEVPSSTTTTTAEDVVSLAEWNPAPNSDSPSISRRWRGSWDTMEQTPLFRSSFQTQDAVTYLGVADNDLPTGPASRVEAAALVLFTRQSLQ